MRRLTKRLRLISQGWQAETVAAAQVAAKLSAIDAPRLIQIARRHAGADIAAVETEQRRLVQIQPETGQHAPHAVVDAADIAVGLNVATESVSHRPGVPGGSWPSALDELNAAGRIVAPDKYDRRARAVVADGRVGAAAVAGKQA